MAEAAFRRLSGGTGGDAGGDAGENGGGGPASSGARALMICALGLTAALAWALMLWMAAADETAAASAAAAAPAPQFTPGQGVMLALMWVVMMFAMMLPSAAPAVLAYHDIAHAARTKNGEQKGAKGKKGASAPLFAAGYMAVWSLLGAVLACAQMILAARTGQTGMDAALPPAWGGALLIAAGLYQLTPQKDVCLRECRSPLAFFMRHWREGRLGALRLGARHGAFCAGCCWMLMLLMFAGGAMNIALMAVLTLVMGAEKLLHGVWPSRILAAACVCAGAALMAAGHGG